MAATKRTIEKLSIETLREGRPLIKLTVALNDTYKRIHDLYYQERDARKAARGTDDATDSPTRL